MRPAAPPPKPKYVFQQYPKIMYPSTELLAKGLNRIKTANSEAEQSAFESQGYQTTQAAAPAIAPTSTKEEALAKQKEQFDAAWDKKMAELATAQKQLESLQTAYANLKEQFDAVSARLAKVTMKIEQDKKAAAAEKPAAPEEKKS